MLQLTNFYEQCFQNYSQNNPEALTIKNVFQEFEIKRKNHHLIDHLLWTTKREHIDDPDFNIENKKEIIQGLHLKNTVFGTYKTSIEILRPLINEINSKENRPAKILEVGCGMGQLTMALYKQLKESSLAVELTGSDIVHEYIKLAQAKADLKKYNIHFQMINAYELAKLPMNSFDIVFTLHTMHHFTPEELGCIIKGSNEIKAKAFVGIDGYRGLSNLFFISFSGAIKSLMSLNSTFFHDSFISGRKMYSAKQLEIIAKLSGPHSMISTERKGPGLTILKVLNY